MPGYPTVPSKRDLTVKTVKFTIFLSQNTRKCATFSHLASKQQGLIPEKSLKTRQKHVFLMTFRPVFHYPSMSCFDLLSVHFQQPLKTADRIKTTRFEHGE